MDEIKFPKNFLWGAGISSYQTEGNNINTDWCEWEKRGKTKDKCGSACDYWNRYEEYHKLAQELGINAFRMSLEWARIEPEEGQFSVEAIEQYRKILRDIKFKGMKRVVTLWHYTVPLWFCKKYGWQKKESVEIFLGYCKKVFENLNEEIDILITINEPRLPLNRGYLIGTRPPGKVNIFSFLKARKNMIEAHKKCFQFMKSKNDIIPVGITQFMNDFDFFGRIKFLKILTEKIEDFYNWYFFKAIGECQDFIGINYYFGIKVSLKYPFISMAKEMNDMTDMGWGIYSEGLNEIIKHAWNYFRKPIYIFENGIADKKDSLRNDYIKKHLNWVEKCVKKGIDVRGYFYWSLIDNFEWEDGFEKRFGLVEIDYKNLDKRPRPSFYFYRDLIKKYSE